MKSFWTALTFLTILPSPKKYSADHEKLGESAVWFPLVGVFIGGITALAFLGFQLFLPSTLASVFTVLVWIVLTGGLHLDGLADCMDGMLNSSSADRRIEIMKDPRIGTFGAVGLVFIILLKVAAVHELELRSTWIAIPMAACLARWLLLWAGSQKMARRDGLGASYQLGIRPWYLVFTGIFPLILVFIAGLPGLVAAVFACLSAFTMSVLARARLGGMTGDVLGCIVEVTEVAVLIAFNLPIHGRFL
jgi:adenosylcobinamide-GDP ribazoletransferase